MHIKVMLALLAQITISSLHGMKPETPPVTKKERSIWRSLEKEIKIKPDTLQQKIMILARENRFDEIDTLIANATPADITSMLLMQCNMAIFLTERLNFKSYAKELLAFNYPKQTKVEKPTDPGRAQWLFLLMNARKKIIPQSESNVLLLLQQFLTDIGFDVHFPEYYFDILKKPTPEEMKKGLSKNFKLLFEALLHVTKLIKPTHTASIYKYLLKD